MVDPRTSVIHERLAKIGRIVAVSSGKGGVGKSMVATILALTLARQGCKVGLFDLDFTSPSTHIILGAPNVKPKEEKGIIPATVKGDIMALRRACFHITLVSESPLILANLMYSLSRTSSIVERTRRIIPGNIKNNIVPTGST